MGRIDFGVVNHNGGSAVVECVRSILAQEGPECRVWVFDNASVDGSAAAVEAAFPEVEVIRSGENLGYAGALNGLVARMDAPVTVLSNMDVVFDPGWASAVADALEGDPGADCVATLVLEATDPPVVNSVGVRFFGDLHAQNVGSGAPYRPEAVARAREGAFGSYGAVMCFRRGSVTDLEFDDDYFLFFEETDFFLRFHLLGRSTIFAPGAVARHRRSLSTRRYSPLKLYYGERNRLTTVFKLLPLWYWPVALACTIRRLTVLAGAVGGAGRSGGTSRTARSASAGAGAVETEGSPEVGEGERVVLPSIATIIGTLLRAWGGALVRLPGTLRKRRRFYRRAAATPGDALALLRRYALPASELRLR